jgi:type II secretory pathway component PulC
MGKCRRLFIMLIFLGSYVIALQTPPIEKVCYGQSAGVAIKSAQETGGKTVNTRKEKNPVDPYAKEIKKNGDIVVISKSFADLARKNNSIILSKVAIQQRLDDAGKIAGYELVSIDRGSVVEKTGLRPHDLVTGVNGVLARDFNESRESLEECNRFDITILRKGKTKNIIIEIQPFQSQTTVN